MGVVGDTARDAAGALADALQRAFDALAGTVSGASAGWLALGVLLHLANQIVRGRGWYAILRTACDGAPVRRRDAIAAWVAGAGAGGVLSARGGDAIRVFLLGRRAPDTRASVLAAVLAGAAPALGLPGAETIAAAAAALGLLALVALFVCRHGGASDRGSR